MISQALLPEFDHEMGTTRKYLDRLPEAHADFKPHERSMSLINLANHVVGMVSWVETTLAADELDVAGYQPSMKTTRTELLALFDQNVVAARAAIERLEDSEWMRPWALKVSGQTVFTMPKIGVMRGMIMNHIIHHRAQLGVYYRLVEVAVPATYGPSADES